MKNEKMFIHPSDIVALVAKWAVRLNNYGALPIGFVPLIEKLHESIKDTGTLVGMMEFESVRNLEEFIKEKLMAIPEFKELNLRKVERDMGLTAKDVDTPERERRPFPDRYDENYQLKPEYEFIDLGALIGNVMNDIRREEEMNRKMSVGSI